MKKIAVARLRFFSNLQLDNRVRMPPLPENPADENEHGQNNSGQIQFDPNQSSSWPLSSTICRQPTARRDQSKTDVIDADALSLLLLLAKIRRILDQAMRQIKREQADGNVDIKNPAPAIIVGDPAAQRGTDRGSHHHRHSVNGKRHAALGRRKCIRKDGLLARLQASAPGALQDAEKHQQPEARRQPAKETARREKRHARHVEALAPESRGQPRADGQHDAVGNQIARQNPGGLVGASPKAARDMRQRDIGNGSVEHFHKRRQRDGEGDQPRVVPRMPVRRIGGSRYCSSHEFLWCAAAISL